MATQPTGPGESVTVFRDGLLTDDNGKIFSGGSISESTHLPTGTASSRSHTVTIPPGGDMATLPGDSGASLLCVTSGQLTLRWGRDLERVTTASVGDAVLVPAGIACSVRNDSAVDTLEFVRVRSG